MAFYAAYHYGMSFSRTIASPFWFPDVVLLCALLLNRPRNWWIYIIGALPIRLFSSVAHGVPIWFLLATFAIDSGKGVLVAWGIQRFIGYRIRLQSVKELGIFCLIAVLLVPALAAFAGAGIWYLRGSQFWPAWQQWFLGDAMTHAILTPAVLWWLLAWRTEIRKLSGMQYVEAILLVVALILTARTAFSTRMNGIDFPNSDFYAPIPLLFWAAVRFGMPGVSGAIAILTCLAVNAALHGSGPFYMRSSADAASILQEYLLFRTVPLYLIAIVIHQKEDVEQSLRESERRFRMMADTAPVLIWVAGPDKLCTFFNQPWLKFRGRTMEQELGNGWAEGVHPEDFTNCLKTYYESFAGRQPFTMEYRLRRYDGTYRWISDQGVPRYDDARNEFLGYIGSCVDVTERKEAEAESQRWQRELAHVGRVSTLGALAGSLSHELRQPLAAIVISAEAAQRLMDDEPPNDEEMRDTLKDIAEQGRRAGEIISEMRGMLKKDPGQMSAQDINEAVKSVLEIARSDFVTKGVMAVSRLDPLLPPVKGHGVQLQQVILNLVMNACDAMAQEPAENRKLLIESRRVTAQEVEVSVADTGPGFPDEMLQRGFEPFRTTKVKGLGLGLTICRSIITAHGGRMVAANNAEKGATVRFTLLAQNHNGI
jgi:PAS domain S-box-containing protein